MVVALFNGAGSRGGGLSGAFRLHVRHAKATLRLAPILDDSRASGSNMAVPSRVGVHRAAAHPTPPWTMQLPAANGGLAERPAQVPPSALNPFPDPEEDYRLHPERYRDRARRTGRAHRAALQGRVAAPLAVPHSGGGGSVGPNDLQPCSRRTATPEDGVGMDMARKFLQMGFTRSRRYANHKGGRKYDADGNVRPLARSTREKAASAEIVSSARLERKRRSDPVIPEPGANLC